MDKYCTKCGSPLDPSTGSCPNCNSQEKESSPNGKNAPPKRTQYTTLVIIVLLLIAIVVGILNLSGGYGFTLCRHQWHEATCAQPRYCDKCGMTKGAALGHIPGEMEYTYNFIAETTEEKQFCERCGACLSDITSSLDSFVQDGKFLFTPRDFIDNMMYIARNVYPHISWRLDTNEDVLRMYVTPGDGSSDNYVIEFFDADSNRLHADDDQSQNVWSVCLEQYREAGGKNSYEPVDPAILAAFCKACAPSITNDDFQLLNAMYYASFLNWKDHEEESGYHHSNDLLYEFSFAVAKPLGHDTQLCDRTYIRAYASDWLSQE